MEIAGFKIEFPLQRFADFAQPLRRRTDPQAKRCAQMRDKGGFADSIRAENQDVFALRVQPLKQRDFFGATDKWQRDAHGSHGIHRFVISQNTNSTAQQAGSPQFTKA